MKLTLKTDYALRVLIYLQSKEKATIKEIAEFYDIKKNHLSVVVNKLSDLNYVHSSTGPTGGVSLNSQTLQKSVGDIILQFEDFELVECFRCCQILCVNSFLALKPRKRFLKSNWMSLPVNFHS